MFKHIFCRHMLVYWANSLSKDDLHRNMKIFICQKLSTLAPIQDVCNSNIWIQRILYTQRNANEERSTGSMSPALLCNPIESNQLFAGQLLLEVRWGSSPPRPPQTKFVVAPSWNVYTSTLTQRLDTISLYFHELYPLIWWAWSKNKYWIHFKICTSSSSSAYWAQCTEVPWVNTCKTTSKLAGERTETKAPNTWHLAKKKKE